MTGTILPDVVEQLGELQQHYSEAKYRVAKRMLLAEQVTEGCQRLGAELERMAEEVVEVDGLNAEPEGNSNGSNAMKADDDKAQAKIVGNNVMTLGWARTIKGPFQKKDAITIEPEPFKIDGLDFVRLNFKDQWLECICFSLLECLG